MRHTVRRISSTVTVRPVGTNHVQVQTRVFNGSSTRTKTKTIRIR